MRQSTTPWGSIIFWAAEIFGENGDSRADFENFDPNLEFSEATTGIKERNLWNWSSDFGTCIQLLRQAGRQWPNYQVKRGVTYRKFFKNANRDSKHTTVSSSTQRTYHPEKNSRYSKKNSIYQTWLRQVCVQWSVCAYWTFWSLNYFHKYIFWGVWLSKNDW